MPCRKADDRMLRRVGLHNHAPRLIRAACPAGHLRQELECTLPTPVIGDIKHSVRCDHANKRYVWNVEPLCDHLRADEHLRFTARKAAKQRFMRIFCARGIKVHPHGGNAWKLRCKLLFHLLRSYAKPFKVRFSAFRANLWDARSTPAIMAFHHAFELVVGHRNIAIRAFHHIPTPATGDERGISAPVHKENRLLPCAEALTERSMQRCAENAVIPCAKLVAQIHDLHLRHRLAVDALWKRQKLVYALETAPVASHRRRCASKHKHCLIELRALCSDLQRAIARSKFGMIGWLVLLIHHNKLQPRKRREHRAARANDHIHFS